MKRKRNEVYVAGYCFTLNKETVMIQLTIKNNFGYKDQAKANIATKFIGRGSVNSSTNQYCKDFGAMANTGNYTSNDIVFISAEGNRTGRLNPDFNEIALAIKAKATIITDVPYHRNRSYNIGERQVVEYLKKANYQEEEQDYFSLWSFK